MTTDQTNQLAPETPAASLLFQAPAFQAPSFSEESAGERKDLKEKAETRGQRTRSKRANIGEQDETSQSKSSDDALQQDGEEKPRRKRRAKAVEDTDAPSDKPAKKRTRRLATQSDPEVETEVKDEQPLEAGEVNGAELESASVDSEEVEGTTRRRRRRRTRSTSTEELGDATDQVKALKGSTRLEAKKQRRREGRKEGRRHHGITESEFLARRESVNRKMVIRDHEGLNQIAIVEDDLLVEHYVARRTQQSMVGNIYLGRVQNVLPSMEAAFVDIGRGRNAVLYAGEVNWDAVGLDGKPRRIESALKSGDPVLVQVTKDPIGHKGARLTSQITLAGRYLVLIPNGSMMGISRKLPDKERNRLKKILKQVVPAGSGVIVRTAAEGATEQQILDDVSRLTKQWADIEKKHSSAKSAPVLLRGEPELAVRVVRDIFNEDFSSLVVQGKTTYETIKEYVDELSPELSDRVEQWVGTDDVFHANRIDEQLAKGMDRKVWLPSGGTLIIERTEAMTVIDVNTGKFIGAGGTLEETVTRNNLEAAEEIVRQLRLRDIGGIVIIDFVDMVLESNRDLVLRRLVECLGRDRTRHQVTEITSLGLVQMTRKRVGEGLIEAFSTTCEACEGRGFIVHEHPVELTGSHDHTGNQPKKRQKKTSSTEPRRIDDSPEHEKAKQALSAIAAATHKDEVEAKDVEETSMVAVDPQTEHDSVSNQTDSKQAKASRPRKTRKAVTADSQILEQNSPDASASNEDPSLQQDSAAAGASAASSEEVSAPPVTKRPRRRRRAVVAEAGEPEKVAVENIVELPTRVEQKDEAVVRSTDDIALPEPAPAPKTKRRRRVASTGVVDTG
ncbi:Rne/Rng family ribonuclease [Schaalia vaccimaxillae]|uniref:Rne/Rng family ribonuclease n=1 Tax=Schaalia vaccimaxillae TaxID=183916 RepID=UPI0003B3C3BB